jgi:hypothetical protein
MRKACDDPQGPDDPLAPDPIASDPAHEKAQASVTPALSDEHLDQISSW